MKDKIIIPSISKYIHKNVLCFNKHWDFVKGHMPLVCAFVMEDFYRQPILSAIHNMDKLYP